MRNTGYLDQRHAGAAGMLQVNPGLPRTAVTAQPFAASALLDLPFLTSRAPCDGL